VFVLRDDKTLVEMKPANFATEDDFQRLLANFPTLLDGAQIDRESPRQWILVAREKSVPSEDGALDDGLLIISSLIRTAFLLSLR
jgi:hypothetical protein